MELIFPIVLIFLSKAVCQSDWHSGEARNNVLKEEISKWDWSYFCAISKRHHCLLHVDSQSN